VPRKRPVGAAIVVHRSARVALRTNPAQANGLFALLVSAGDVWACVLQLNEWRLQRGDRPLVGYQELCPGVTRAVPGGRSAERCAGRGLPWPAPSSQLRGVARASLRRRSRTNRPCRNVQTMADTALVRPLDSLIPVENDNAAANTVCSRGRDAPEAVRACCTS
jgi:hypothetical protein